MKLTPLFKGLTAMAFFAMALMVSGCYDDTDIQERLRAHEARIQQLENTCKEMNTNIASLQQMLSSLQNNDFVTGITPIVENGKEIGYTISFSKSGSVTIYHGKDGKDGTDGQNGKDGTDGKDGEDGSTPVIGVQQDEDGIWYWTLNGDWLLDGQGNKVKASGTDGKDGENGANGERGKDGVTPQLKIEADYWYISYDNGTTWTKLGKATGENGKDGKDGKDGENGKDGASGNNGQDGKSFFSSVTYDDVAVYLKLANGTTITLPRLMPLAVSFDAAGDTLIVKPTQVLKINYNITSDAAVIKVEVTSSADLKALVMPTDKLNGTIRIETGATVDKYSKVTVFVNAGTTLFIKTFYFIQDGTWSLIGDFNDWSDDVDMKEISEGVWQSPPTHLSGDFLLRQNHDFNKAKVGADNADEPFNPALGVAFPATDGGKKIHVDDNYYIVTYDTDAGTLLVEQAVNLATAFQDAKFRAFIAFNFDQDNDGFMTSGECEQVTDLDIETDDITSLKGIECFPNLESLTAVGQAFWDDEQQKVVFTGGLTAVDLSKNTALTDVDLHYNNLLAIDLSKNVALTNLSLYGNCLTTLDLTFNTALQKLWFDDNPLTVVKLIDGHNYSLLDGDTSVIVYE